MGLGSQIWVWGLTRTPLPPEESDYLTEYEDEGPESLRGEEDAAEWGSNEAVSDPKNGAGGPEPGLGGHGDPKNGRKWEFWVPKMGVWGFGVPTGVLTQVWGGVVGSWGPQKWGWGSQGGS